MSEKDQSVDYWKNMFYDLLEEVGERLGSDDYLIEQFNEYAKELESNNE